MLSLMVMSQPVISVQTDFMKARTFSNTNTFGLISFMSLMASTTSELRTCSFSDFL